MIRTLVFVISVLLFGPARADDPPKKLTTDERKELEAKGRELSAAGGKAYQAGKLDEGAKAWAEALQIARRLYPKDQYPDGHVNLAFSLNNLGFLYEAQRRYSDAEPLFRDALAMRKRLFKGDHPLVAMSLNNLGFTYKSQGKYADAESLYRKALEMRKALFKGNHPSVAFSLNNLAALYEAQGKLMDAEPLYREAIAAYRSLFKGDHPDLAQSLNGLAATYQGQGRLVDAELLYREALAMVKRLFKGDHPEQVSNLNNLATLYQGQGKLSDAELLFREALAMNKRLFKGDHPDLAPSLNNLAALLKEEGKLAEAEPLYRDALDMLKRLFKGDHPLVATSLNNQASLYQTQGKPMEAELPYRQALEMRKRLFKGDHPDVAVSLNNLATLYETQGKLVEAEPLYRDALAMIERLFKSNHPMLARSKCQLGGLYHLQEKYADAEPLFLDAFAMNGRLIASYAGQKSEGEALTLIASLPLTRDAFLSNAQKGNSDPRTVYSVIWSSKGMVARIYEQRQLAVRAVATDLKAANMLAELAGARRRRAELILAPEVKDPTTRKKREENVEELEAKIAVLDRAIHPLLPEIARAENLANATPAELQKALPADVAVVDFIRYLFIEFDRQTPGTVGVKQTARYLAFIVTRDKITWMDLHTAAKIETAVTAWREAITSGKDVPTTVPAKVRELVWDKVRKELPAGIKTVYVSPDAALCRVPWGALPGDKPGTILLEEFAVATIPHATFLLDKLQPREPPRNPPTGALVVGGIKYDVEPSPSSPNAVQSRGDPLVKPDQKLGWSFLPGTAAEANGVASAAASRKLLITSLKDEKATTPAVLAALPKARYAHFATHGFFADPSFRSVFQLDEKDYEKSWRGERIGHAAISPMVMTGLVFAGANNPKTPGRGILTGESLIDLDLSGLELAVLSACETGLGDVAGGEGTFGLQRAFHLAGTRDVIASQWKVPDQSTAALMALFYRNLWMENLSPMESLRQAQLEIYRNPSKIPELAKGFRGKFEEVPGMGEIEIKPTQDGKAQPILWAAFCLSGPGRYCVTEW